jgi:N-acetylmuramoyl-L-alanine amidase
MVKRLIPATLLLMAAAAGQSTEKRVSAVRAWPLAEVTRVAIEVSGEFDYRSERLTNPDRVFFDLPGTRPLIDGRRFAAITLADRLIHRIRVAETQPGTTRIVFDLAAPVEFTVSELVNPDRLVVEFRASTAAPPPVRPPLTLPVASEPAATAARLPEPPPLNAAAAPKPADTPKIEPPKAARPQGDGGRSLIRALGLKTSRMVIDAGHGGHDTGTIGPRGYTEKELVLDLSQRLGKLVAERLGIEVVYTRTEDVFIPLEARTALANEKKADLFLSLHANSSSYPGIAGAETYFLSITSDRSALEVAARENASSQKSIHELRDVITTITRYEKADESKDLAERLQAALHAFSARAYPGLRNRGVKKAPFMVLIGAEMPSVLAEVAFLSNAREEALLKRPEHRQRLAEALYQGVYRWVTSLSRYQVAQAAAQ